MHPPSGSSPSLSRFLTFGVSSAPISLRIDRSFSRPISPGAVSLSLVTESSRKFAAVKVNWRCDLGGAGTRLSPAKCMHGEPENAMHDDSL
jgi:hypothetical protein